MDGAYAPEEGTHALCSRELFFFPSEFLSTSIDWEIPLVLSPFFPISFISLQQYGPSKAFYNTMESKRFL